MTMEMDRHILTLTARGRLRPPADGSAPRAAVRRILDGFAQSGRPSMTINFHGGMVNEATARNLAHHFLQEISDNFDSYPVFVIWQSGPLETLQSAMLEINSSSPLFMQVFKKLTKWTARLLGRGAVPEFAPADLAPPAPTPDELTTPEFFTPPLDELLRMIDAEQVPMGDGDALAALDALVTADIQPVSDADVAELQQALADDADADRALGTIMLAARVQPSAVPVPEMAVGGPPSTASATGHLAAAIVEQLTAASAGPADAAAAPVPESFTSFSVAGNWFFAGDVLRSVMARFAAGSDHGFFGTILEEMYRIMYADKVGRFLWDEMKENAADAYAPLAVDAADDDMPGGTLFLEEIKAFMAQHGPFDLNVMGHSAGSIHIAHFIAAGAALMPDQFSLCNVVFTAPAINYALFKEAIAANDACIGNFRIFTMTDRYERRDPLVKLMPLLYPHSLLYLVSGIFEDQPDYPLLGLDRHLQGTADAEVQAFLDIFQSALFAPIVYAVTPEGTPTGEQAHFTSHYGARGPNFDRATLNSVANQIRPAPLTDLEELAAAPPAQADVLEPAADIIVAGERQRGGLPAEELEAIERGILGPMPGGGVLESGPILEQIIDTNDLIDHAFVDAFVRAGRAVARIVAMGVRDMATILPDARADAWVQAQQAGSLVRGYGTGWILGSPRRVLITNNHVLPLAEAARTARIEFGYERILHRGTAAAVVLKLRPDRLFITDPNMTFQGLDYSVIALSRPAPAELGFLEPLQGITAHDARDIFIVQHPGGGGKAYVLNNNRKVNLPDRYVTYISDTLEGSSGAPLFNGKGDLVGIHHVGNYVAQIGTSEKTTNLGSRIEFVVEDIAQKLRAQTAMDEAQVVYWFGEHSRVLRAWQQLG